MFYYHTQVKISYSENDIETNNKAYSTLHKLVLKTGYTRFLSVTQKYILD